MQVCKYASMQVCKYASTQVCKYASMQVCKYASMKVCRYASIHTVFMRLLPNFFLSQLPYVKDKYMTMTCAPEKCLHQRPAYFQPWPPCPTTTLFLSCFEISAVFTTRSDVKSIKPIKSPTYGRVARYNLLTPGIGSGLANVILTFHIFRKFYGEWLQTDIFSVLCIYRLVRFLPTYTM